MHFCESDVSAPSGAQFRAALLDVLSLVRADVAQLAEMIRMLRNVHGMDSARMRELALEWRVAKEREFALERELDGLPAAAGGEPARGR